MTYIGLDIGGNTGFTVFDLVKRKLLEEVVLDTRNLSEEESAELIINKMQDSRLRNGTQVIVISEAFISSRTMKIDVFRSARIEAMVRFWITYFEPKKYEYHNQIPQKRLPFVDKSKTWVTTKGTTRCHIVDSFAHILAHLHEKNIELPTLHKSGSVKKELKVEEYDGKLEF
jgi:hypothetical protein